VVIRDDEDAAVGILPSAYATSVEARAGLPTITDSD
jgi:hypothetical protein